MRGEAWGRIKDSKQDALTAEWNLGWLIRIISPLHITTPKPPTHTPTPPPPFLIQRHPGHPRDAGRLVAILRAASEGPAGSRRHQAFAGEQRPAGPGQLAGMSVWLSMAALSKLCLQ